jgi:lysophospholipase L1-like esterase
MKAPRICYTALGDSLSFGLGAFLFQGYARMLSHYFKETTPFASTKNTSKILATGGELLFQLRSNLGVRSAVSCSNLLTISIGGNNLLRALKNNYTAFNEEIALQGVYNFSEEWPLILHEIRACIGYDGPAYVMTVYNPCRCDDPRYPLFDKYIRMINSVIRDRELVSAYNYEIVDVYKLFEANHCKDWTYLYHTFSNIHPTTEGHRQMFLLHRDVMGI